MRAQAPQDKYQSSGRKKVKDIEIFYLLHLEDFPLWQAYLARATKGLGIPRILQTTAVRKRRNAVASLQHPGAGTRGHA